jgi:hypothetical protein
MTLECEQHLSISTLAGCTVHNTVGRQISRGIKKMIGNPSNIACLILIAFITGITIGTVNHTILLFLVRLWNGKGWSANTMSGPDEVDLNLHIELSHSKQLEKTTVLEFDSGAYNKIKPMETNIDDFGALRESKSFADFKIQTKDGKVFETHKSFLAGSSSF